jgi:uncharacterized protein (TIGR02271 family)
VTTMTDAYTWQGRELLGSDGEKIGSIKEIYEDVHTGKPEWALVTSGLFGTRSHFVPLAGAQPEGEGVRVDATKEQVKSAPSIEGEGQLSEADERTLFEHYNVPYTNEGSVTADGIPGANGQGGAAWYDARSGAQGGATGYDTSGPNTDDAMTRSEEELRVGTAQQERGRARLRKYIVTEEVQTTVPVQREEVRVEREPITDANIDQAMDGPELSEEEHEVVLHEEQPVVEKRTVPKERVALRKDTVADERQVSEQVRKEQIEPEGDHL